MIQKVLIALTVLVVSAIVYGYFFMYVPNSRKNLYFRSTIQQLRADVESAIQAQAKLTTLKKQFEGERAKYDLMVAQFPKRNQTGILLEEITKIAPKEGIKFDEVSPQEITRKTGPGQVKYDELRVKILLRTSFPILGKYLEDLEKIPFFADVSDLEIRTSQKSKLITVSMEVTTMILAVEK